MNARLARPTAILFAATIFLSALLLFAVQPVLGKFILPWFGGSPAVWTTAMVFFQTTLLAGYAYAHLNQKLPPRWGAALHVFMLLAALCLLPITPGANWKPLDAQAPAARILLLLVACVGLPYMALSATGPLVQAWHSRAFQGGSPYRLYALSNAGSLLALIGYPFVAEPLLSVTGQTAFWTVCFVCFALLCAACALLSARLPRAVTNDVSVANTVASCPTSSSLRPERTYWFGLSWTALAWIGLPALSSAMLLAVTNHVCQDVAVAPMLWVAPLALYLLSFIITFDHARWYDRRVWAVLTIALLGALVLVDQLITTGSGIAFSFYFEAGLHFAALFALCMTCHGEVVRLRPEPGKLTSYYLHISAGGALGGLLISLVAPRVFDSYVEWKIGLIAGCLLAANVLLTGQRSAQRRLAFGSPVLFLVLAGWLPLEKNGGALEVRCRSFYGACSVLERDLAAPENHAMAFYSGRIMHGLQFAAGERRRRPTLYYGPKSGIGRTFQAIDDAPRKIGAVGLGVGVLSSYLRPTDSIAYYELNPDVLTIARKYFTFLGDCRGKTEVILGDARLTLERQASQAFDLLVLDAFSGDAVPTHLLTREMLDTYLRHLKPRGVLAMHVSNRYLNLAPVARGLADAAGMNLLTIDSQDDIASGTTAANWVLLTRNDKVLSALRPYSNHGEMRQRSILWTDQRSNLLELLK